MASQILWPDILVGLREAGHQLHRSSEFGRRLEVEFHQNKGSPRARRILPLARTARQASFPRGCIIDTERHMLCRFVNGKTCLGRADKTDLLALKRLIPPARWGASRRSGALMSSEKAETTAEKSISDSTFQVSWDRCKNKRHSCRRFQRRHDARTELLSKYLTFRKLIVGAI